jgi:hypothetical protein
MGLDGQSCASAAALVNVVSKTDANNLNIAGNVVSMGLSIRSNGK